MNSNNKSSQLAFTKIALYGRIQSDLVSHTLRHIIFFLSELGCDLVLESSAAAGLADLQARPSASPGFVQDDVLQDQAVDELLKRIPTNDLDTIGEVSDLLIVVGGDGCMLGAARALAGCTTPLVGVNRGRLGFLTDVNPLGCEQALSSILAHDFFEEQRFLLACEVQRHGCVIGAGDAFNDIVLHASQGVQMIEFELSIDGDFVYNLQSDGLIISTPTGSTAYALSAGGPIMHPNLEAISLVPMCPHTLSSRPIVVNAKAEIMIVVQPDRSLTPPQLSFDGQQTVQLQSGDVIHVRQSVKMVRLIHPLDHTFYKSARSKLGWHSSTTAEPKDGI